MAYQKKLYFDVTITVGATAPGGSIRSRLCPCTWLATVAANRVRERYGNLLQPAAALTGGAPSRTKLGRSTSAWFQAAQNFTNAGRNISLDFVGQDYTTPIPYRLPGGALSASLAGTDPIYTGHFAVRVRNLTVHVAQFHASVTVTAHSGATAVVYAHPAGVGLITGVLYVQRLHAIEA